MSVIRQATIHTRLPEGSCLGELLRFGQMSTLGSAPESVAARLARFGARLWRQMPANEQSRLIETAMPAVRHISIDIAPHREVIGWESPLPLTLTIATWPESPRHVIGYLPALGVEIIARSEEELLTRAAGYARMLLSRRGIARDLRIWARLARWSSAEAAEINLELEPLTAVEVAKRRASESETRPRSELKRAASNLRKLKLEPAFEVDLLLRRIAEGLGATPARPLLLIGPSGVGKTAAVRELVRQRERFGLTGQRFWQTDGSRLVAGMTGFGMWQQRCASIIREARRIEAILFLGNLVELMQVGRHAGNEQGIASFFKPYLLRGEFRAIAECTVEQRHIIESEDAHLLSLFDEIDVHAPDQPRRLRILRAVADLRAKERAAPIDDDALNRLDALHERFATYSAAPGRPVRFLTNLLRAAHDRKAVTESQVTGAFAQETGLPLFMIDDATPLHPDHARDWFSQRVIGQGEAVRRVVDTLVVVKANLSRPARPIASLLFIGPTGVGKTQMAKSLAEYLFGDADRLTRFDMTEYGDSAAITRLTRASAGGEGLLTAKVREQPFGVLLFDEFEKAHPSFFDLLLQVLGEGRLTDGAGRLADFTNTVIIMTSNLGAEAYAAERFGFAPRQDPDESHHFIEAVRDFLRPELFNRIDRTVPFAPLGRAVMRSIALREVERVRQRDGLALRGVALNLDDAVIDHLVETGFDAKLGARPLQRAIERQLLAPLADGINAYGRDTALTARACLTDGKLAVTVLAATEAGVARIAAVTASPLAGALQKITAMRRQSQRLAGCSALLELRNEAERLRRLIRLKERLKQDVWSDPAIRQLPRIEQVIERVDAGIVMLVSAEDDAAAQLYNGETPVQTPAGDRVNRTEREWRGAMLDVYCRRFASPDELLLGVYSDQPALILTLVECYRIACADYGAVLEAAPLFTWTAGAEAQPREGAAVRVYADIMSSEPVTELLHGRRYVWRGELRAVKEPLESLPRSSSLGILLRARGPHITALLAAEGGAHRFRGRSETRTVLVDASAVSLTRYRPPAGIEVDFDAAVEPLPTRRGYDERSSTVDDKVLDRRTGWSLEHSVFGLPRLIVEACEKLLEDMLDE